MSNTQNIFASNTRNSRAALQQEEKLTIREAEILQLAADGFNNKTIAAKLELATLTVDTHVSNILAKLKAKNMKHAVAIGIKKNR